ncbi:uncharacterized protein LOC120349643 [Nilaparvata lugens]|uniref:uncharacterized protein LOC120349643 n=1 Tax=Nilaparvata lugens TaxID=108931 RepID=UPI00193D37C6|nr:uncharacterized protein LOC120349643 [Nilaparvata lugens]
MEKAWEEVAAEVNMPGGWMVLGCCFHGDCSMRWMARSGGVFGGLAVQVVYSGLLFNLVDGSLRLPRHMDGVICLWCGLSPYVMDGILGLLLATSMVWVDSKLAILGDFDVYYFHMCILRYLI